MANQKFIVVFKDNVKPEDVQKYADELDQSGGKVTNNYAAGGGILNGFAAEIPEEFLQKLQSLKGDEIVDYIEPDGPVSIQPVENNTSA